MIDSSRSGKASSGTVITVNEHGELTKNEEKG